VCAAVTAELFSNSTATPRNNVQCIDLQLVSVSSSQNLTCDKCVLADKIAVKVKVRDDLHFAATSSLNVKFIRPCIVIYFYGKTNQMHQFIKFIFVLF